MDIEKVVSLARLQLTDKEMNGFSEQMTSILSYFEDLKDVDTKGVEPLVTPTEITKDYRADESIVWKEASLALELAPQKKGNLFQVPPVV